MSDKALTGAAGVFHVASVFSLRGMIALPTIRNTAGYDIIVTSRDGSKHANVQVKTASGRPDFWPICKEIDGVKTSEHDYYVLLRRTSDNGTFEGFMLTGKEMKNRRTPNEVPAHQETTEERAEKLRERLASARQEKEAAQRIVDPDERRRSENQWDDKIADLEEELGTLV